jgi:hypothetical protein
MDGTATRPDLAETRTGGPEGRIQALGAQGRRLLDAGQLGEAALLFERVLLHAPHDEAAREGLDRARAAASEAERTGRAQLDAADAALARGDRGEARRILEDLLLAGHDPDGATTRLEKLDERGGLVTRPAPAPRAVREAGLPPRPARPLSRRAFATFWCLLVLSLGASVAFSWERLVGQLVEAPAPDARLVPPATRLPQPTAGELALTEARRRVEAGDVKAALVSLDGIGPGEAVYPFARQLRERLAHGEAAVR